jgi:hypothetical protein
VKLNILPFSSTSLPLLMFDVERNTGKFVVILFFAFFSYN